MCNREVHLLVIKT